MAPRKQYKGSQRKLVVGIDVGTTFSGVSYAILDPGVVPNIQGVNRYPATERVGGDAKIPSIIYYDKGGTVRAVGAEALLESNLELAEVEHWTKVEWFKLHLRPHFSLHTEDDTIPPLPPNKSVVQVFGDFLKYLYECTRSYIQETHASGPELWESLRDQADFILTHPNGWEGRQQEQMRSAAIYGGLIPDNLDGHSRVQFVTEGEASLHYCIGIDHASDAIKSGEGVIIVDAGGGTIDLSAYYMKEPDVFEEIAPATCHFQGSVYVSRRAKKFLESKLYSSKYGSPDDIEHITQCFDKSTKLGFKDTSQPSYIRFGTSRDSDSTVDVRFGQVKVQGSDVEKFFEPSLATVRQAIREQQAAASVPVTSVLLVGGFAASDWLFSNLKGHLQSNNIRFSRPDGHLSKAVPDGAIAFYLDHFVTMRVARTTFGTDCSVVFDPSKSGHSRRVHTVVTFPSGEKRLPDAFDIILAKGSRVSETTEFRRDYFQESIASSSLTSIAVDIMAYRGRDAKPEWLDVDPNMFAVSCTVKADALPARALRQMQGRDGNTYYRMDYSIILLFGLTEHKALIRWTDDGVERRTTATIVYDHGVARA